MAILPRYLNFGNDFDIKHVLVNSQIWFNGKEVGEMLEYKEPGRACRDHVKDKYKAYLWQLVDSSELSQWERNSVYISEAGLWMFLGNSKQSRAEAFQDWLWEICLPALRRQMVLEAQRSGLKKRDSASSSRCGIHP